MTTEQTEIYKGLLKEFSETAAMYQQAKAAGNEPMMKKHQKKAEELGKRIHEMQGPVKVYASENNEITEHFTGSGKK